MAGYHSFLFIFIFFIKYIHSFNHNTFIRRHSLKPLSVSSSLVCSVGKTSLWCRAENRTRACLTASRRAANWTTPHHKLNHAAPLNWTTPHHDWTTPHHMEIWSGMFIPDPDLDFLPIPDPGVKKAPDSGSATLLLHTGTFLLLQEVSSCSTFAYV